MEATETREQRELRNARRHLDAKIGKAKAKRIDHLIDRIATETLGDPLREMKHDREDFRDMHVTTIRELMRIAFLAGERSAR